ncbi:hypothetical protein DFJ73DRAFT_797744 [Zopfochytrium polystomum]|nr:hypothetical protein DFJ73DRAFT_797744 [Zopfochytrium polystomum]
MAAVPASTAAGAAPAATTATRSEDIIRHIIRDIVTHSSAILKQQRAAAAAAAAAAGAVATAAGSLQKVGGAGEADGAVPAHNDRDDGGGVAPGQPHSDPDAAAPGAPPEAGDSDPRRTPHPPAPLSPIPHAKHLFTSGIKSHVAPHVVSDTLAAFVVRAVVLDPRNDFRIERELTKEEVERLINLCLEKITTSNNVVMETVKMQVYFDSIFPAQADYMHKEKMTRLAACAPVLREITEVKTKNISVYEGLYRKIVTYVLLRSHVGSPTDIKVVREATAALESVFPQSELSSFISLGRAEKEAQLNGLTQLITGIRLFNKQLGKGGDTVEDLISLCATELRMLVQELEEQTAATEAILQQLMAVIAYASKAVELDMGTSAINRVKSTIIFNRQYLMYLDALTEQTTRTREKLATLSQTFDDTIHDLKSTCKAKNRGARRPGLSFRRGILDTIAYHSKSFETIVTETVLRESSPYKEDIEPEILPVEVIHPGNTTRYFQLPVEYGGFCPHTLMKHDGLVVPGDKNLGMIRYRDRLFAFATQEGAREFAKFPDRCMEGVLELAKRSPDLVQLLHLYNYFPTVEALENAKSFTKQRLMGQMPMVSEAGCQVDTHIIDTKIDKKYQWNEWELRRQALMLVNLKHKQTHSSQTDVSHFRRESETQHYQPKTNATQTYTESATNVPRKPKNKFRVVDLTLDL